jgi:hypothetical protein
MCAFTSAPVCVRVPLSVCLCVSVSLCLCAYSAPRSHSNPRSGRSIVGPMRVALGSHHRDSASIRSSLKHVRRRWQLPYLSCLAVLLLCVSSDVVVCRPMSSDVVLWRAVLCVVGGAICLCSASSPSSAGCIRALTHVCCAVPSACLASRLAASTLCCLVHSTSLHPSRPSLPRAPLLMDGRVLLPCYAARLTAAW